ncbi:MAG: aminotransferase class III-fold pyridoxal phosphate-dependent enzyme [Planctomycetales bacterium]|nr:aminotransferase class III-fold pyridoxal phosphate-dependent enzyme [bacterium]UNM09889.1 MAG: aminotransferase class III-fold pyridoxal phosphate-dependent enzyme [Planctomycetales bacterium]
MFDYLFNAYPEEADRKRILDETFSNYREHMNPGFIEYKRSAKNPSHAVEWRGEGVMMYDMSGHGFIDCLGGYGVFLLGHRHPHVMKRVQQAMERIGLYSQELLNPLAAVLSGEIAKRAPGDLQYVYYHCGGAESNEAALKMARLATGRTRHVSFSKSFHGKTTGALAATNRIPLRQPFGSLLPSFQVHTYDDIDNLDHSITTEVASVIVEPVQGEGGINVPSREFLQAVRARCTEVGAIMHVDEVQSGWGRSGRWFCSEHFGLEPDLVTLGKALGGGMATQSALIANSRAFHGHRENDPDFRGMEKNPWWLTNTFAGSQLSCAASLASIEVYEHDNILQQAEDKGAWLKAQLTELAMQNPQLVREVRGIGLWIGFELQTPELGTRIADELFMRDVLVAQTINNPSTIRIQPPAIITQEQLETVMNAFADSLKAVASAPVGA